LQLAVHLLFGISQRCYFRSIFFRALSSDFSVRRPENFLGIVSLTALPTNRSLEGAHVSTGRITDLLLACLTIATGVRLTLSFKVRFEIAVVTGNPPKRTKRFTRGFFCNMKSYLHCAWLAIGSGLLAASLSIAANETVKAGCFDALGREIETLPVSAIPSGI
jgi:hypothetical protein